MRLEQAEMIEKTYKDDTSLVCGTLKPKKVLELLHRVDRRHDCSVEACQIS